MAYWIPHEKKLRGKKLEITILHKDKSEFRVIAHLRKDLDHAEFVAIRGQLSPFRKPAPKMNGFTLKYKKDAFSLERKRPRT